MTSIVDFALNKAKTTLTIAFLIVIAGTFARQDIPISASPNVQLPFLSISVYLDGASPADTSRLIAKPLENRLKSVPGLKNVSSTSSLSYSRVFTEFEVGYDMDKALIDVKQAVEETKFELPREAEDPIVSEYNEASFPLMNVSIVGNSSIRQKVFYARDLKDKIEISLSKATKSCVKVIEELGGKVSILEPPKVKRIRKKDGIHEEEKEIKAESAPSSQDSEEIKNEEVAESSTQETADK